MKQNTIKMLEKKKSKRNILFTAIETFETPEEIKQFYKDYTDYMKKHGKIPEGMTLEQVVNENIGYVLGYYGKETADLWFKTLINLNHPIFGRRIPF